MSIQTDDSTDTGMSDMDAVASLLAGMNATEDAEDGDEGEGQDDDEDEGEEASAPAPKTPKTPKTPNTPAADEGDDEGEEGDEEADEDEGDDEGEEGEDGEESAAATPAVAADDAVVKVLVDGQEQEFTVGGLKRLAGQEASLTRKSQEADLVGGRAAAVLQGALETILEDLSPYKDVDWVLAGHQMDPEEFAWHRENYTRLQGRYDKLVGAAQEFDSTVTARKVAQRSEEAAEALKVLQDPEKGIPGWNDEVRTGLMAYAVKQGLPEDEVAQIANPVVMRLLHKAQQHDAAQVKLAEQRKVAGEKLKNAPRRVKSGGGREAPQATNSKQQQRLERKLASGSASDADAMAVLLGRWGVAAS